MTEILKRNKALSVNPLKASQPIGGALACLGFDQAIPMLHGSQGCTAFAKVFSFAISASRFRCNRRQWIRLVR